MSEGYVKTNLLENGVAEITFFHPKHNSLPSDVLADFEKAIQDAGANDAVKVIVLKSGGERTFCAGASFDELITINDEKTGQEFFMGFARVINACRKCPKIIIGRVQGKAVGGGVGVASAVDYCLATKYASIKLSELHVGIGPFVIGPAVERKIGGAAFAELALNANAFRSPEWAKEKGLYVDVYDSAEELDEAVMNLANYLVDKNPEAQKMLKKIFWEGTDHWDDLLAERAAMSGTLVLSEYTKNELKKYA